MPETTTTTTTNGADGAAAGAGPTPLSMPGAAATTAVLDGDDAGDDEGGEPTFEELLAERDKWRNQAKRNEGRAKQNADKAKLFDSDAQQWRQAWEREQTEKNRQKTPEQFKAEAEAEASRLIAEANDARDEAEAQVLRYRLADGKLPAFALPLVTGRTEDEITEQVESVSAAIAEYVAGLIPDDSPRRPLPNPLAGLGGQQGSTARDQFRATMQKIL